MLQEKVEVIFSNALFLAFLKAQGQERERSYLWQGGWEGDGSVSRSRSLRLQQRFPSSDRCFETLNGRICAL